MKNEGKTNLIQTLRGEEDLIFILKEAIYGILKEMETLCYDRLAKEI